MFNQNARTQSLTAKKNGLSFVLILSALMAVTSLSTDIYLPAMPVMAKDLQGDAELTITGFLVGFCIAQLIWGPVSDRYCRRLPLFIGLVASWCLRSAIVARIGYYSDGDSQPLLFKSNRL